MPSDTYRMRTMRMFALLISIVLFAVLLTCNNAIADLTVNPTAQLYSAEGLVEIQHAGTTVWEKATANSELRIHESIRTGPESRAALVMSDGIMVRLNENSVFELSFTGSQESVTITSGDAHFLSRKPTSFPEIKTPLVTASIRGTEFTVSNNADKSGIVVLQGSVHAENSVGSVELQSGEQIRVEQGSAPQKSLILNPKDAVQWAIHYTMPFDIKDFSDFIVETESTNPAALAELLAGNFEQAKNAFSGARWKNYFALAYLAAQEGDIDDAISLLDAAPKPWSASQYILRASLALSRGQVQSAAKFSVSAREVLQHLPAASSQALLGLLTSQETMILVAHGKSKEALQLAHQNLENTDSCSAALAFSYALQANNNLEQAMQIINSAAKGCSTNPSLRLRKAELELSFGKSDNAVAELQSLCKTHASPTCETLLGFASLAHFETEQAQAAFQKAISESDGSGLPYLGLGLAIIRQGKLDEGRILLQKAVHLEPTVALYRSYLGKAFFEQEDEILSAQEYNRAIELDAEDPTPYLYRAYQSLSQNKPIPALRDIETSIEKNDNRAVYRSRLLLDQDAAVKSSSLADVYQTLGFSELSRTEAIKSLGQDYANASAHLLLSESYDASFDLTQASISEFLIARLLSPVNFNLVRPNSSGSLGTNEYTALFDADQNRTAIALQTQTKDRSLSPSLAFSGTKDRWGYAFTYDQNYSDGYRDNDRDVEEVVYSSLQYQLTPSDVLLFDVSGDFSHFGDTEISYDPEINDTDMKQVLEDYVGRLGFHHRFSASSLLVGQILGLHSRLSISDDHFPRVVLANLVSGGEALEDTILVGDGTQRTEFLAHGLRGDMQFITDGQQISNIMGVSLVELSQEPEEKGSAIFEDGTPDEQMFASQAENTEGSKRVYNYTTVHLNSWLDLQGGLSYSSLHLSAAPLSVPVLEKTETLEEWSPKAGLILTPASGTTLRAAYFESIGSSGIRELENIEPTIVGGFNQSFFDFFPGTRSRTYAVGIDQKFASETFIGLEARHRHYVEHFPQTFDTATIDIDTGELLDTGLAISDEPDNHHDEDVEKTYVYQIFGDAFATSAEYTHIDDDDYAAGTTNSVQHLQLGMHYFHSNGFLGFVSGNWRAQELKGYDADAIDTKNGTRDFWLLDAGLGYRFPKRHGLAKLSVTNLLDTHYHYLPLDSDPTFFPGIGLKFELAYNF